MFERVSRWLAVCSVVLATLLQPTYPEQAPPEVPTLQPQTYYVSSSQGNDDNNGTTPETPFATVGKVNNLDLQPGDSALMDHHEPTGSTGGK